MNSSKQLLIEAERLAKIGAGQTAGANPDNTLPNFFQQPDFVRKWQAIPNKMAFKIGEVADLVGVKQYVLRYWETEFDELRPKKGANNQRMYSRKNVELALMIQHLLHVERFSIEGARKFMRKRKEEQGSQQKQLASQKQLQAIMTTTQEIQAEIHHLKIRLEAYFRRDI